MSKLNLNPITKTGRPTSHITIQKRKIGSSDIIAAEHRNSKAYFRVDPDREVMSSDLQNTVYLHENAMELFGGLDHSQPFFIHTDVRVNEIPICKQARIHVKDGNEEHLRSYLKESKFLLHRGIEEVADLNGSLTSFEVVTLSPGEYTTVSVTDSTDIEFIKASEVESHHPSSNLAGDSAGSSDPQRKSDDEEVDIDITPEKPTVSFEEDVAGLDEVKEAARMLLALFDPETKQAVTERYGDTFASRGGSILLYGPPGCGKTLVSEAIAYEAAYNTNINDEYGEVKYLPIKGGDILSRYPGEAERRVEAVFEKAHRIAQDGFAVLFFDEIETLIPDRSDDDLQRHERSLTNAFLQEMDTDKIEDNLLVIGATNMPFTIDPAASRRFPLQQFIPQPGEEVMSQVWRKELSELAAANQAIDIDYEHLGSASTGYTPAEITDRVLGADLQRHLVRSVVDDSQEPVTPDTEYLLNRLEKHEAKTIRQFVTSVRSESDKLEGYPAMKEYISEQANRLNISMESGSLFDQLSQEAAPTNQEE